jgi:hypothetical protein
VDRRREGQRRPGRRLLEQKEEPLAVARALVGLGAPLDVACQLDETDELGAGELVLERQKV